MSEVINEQEALETPAEVMSAEELAVKCFCGSVKLEKSVSGHRNVPKDFPDAFVSILPLIQSRDAQLTAAKDARIKELEDALREVVNREGLMFAECSDAEKILDVCREALGGNDAS